MSIPAPRQRANRLMQPLPLVSVVIPTFRRPRQLPSAVASALHGLGRDVEVIVVPNGPDTSWKKSLAAFATDPRVRVEPISTPHANAARNHGLVRARGKYLRFLDDDDVLLPEGAARQCELIESAGADIYSCGIRRVEDDGTLHSDMLPNERDDLVVAMARPGRVCLLHSHLYRRELIADARWNEDIPYEQDTDWILRLCRAREWHWASSGDLVGIWHHHLGARTSKTLGRHTRARVVSAMFLDTARALQSEGRLGPRRADAFAEGLWAYVDANFFKAPIAWSGTARRAIALEPARRPDLAIFRTRLGRKLDPLLVEWALAPPRALASAMRALNRKVAGVRRRGPAP